MRILKIFPLLILCAAVGLAGFADGSGVATEQQENHCFTCHTNPRKLIEITRKIAKLHPQKPGASAETEGEG